MLRGGLGRLVLSTLGQCTYIHTYIHRYICTYIFGEAWEAWGGLGNAWACFGEAWGMFGNASGRLGEAWGGLGTAWGMLCECFGEAWECSPQADLRGSPRGLPLHRVPHRNPFQTQGLPTSRITTRESPHKQNHDQGGSPRAELHMTWEPAHKQNYRNTTRELAGWLAGGITSREPVVHLAGWLAGQRLAGRLAEPQRGPERRTVDTYIEQACHALG